MVEQSKIEKQFGVVVLLDSLGTKGIWKKKDPEKVVKIWDAMVEAIRGGGLKEPGQNKIATKVMAFSDTIIMTHTGSALKDILSNVGLSMATLIPYGIAYDIFFRGCISVGEFYSSDKIVIGPAIDEAAHYYELPQWIGVSAAPSTYKELEKSSDSFKSKYFSKWDVPLRNTIEKNGWIINWKEFQTNSVIFEILKNKKISSLEQILLNELDATNEIEPSLKLRNTLNYLRGIK